MAKTLVFLKTNVRPNKFLDKICFRVETVANADKDADLCG